ncbi:alpha/beta hydrolase [Trinickia caryophylli]|uniref:Pimeloyl-ACP methyl ester carboxylesterase n=1 Tax=Trinickia caryophylli TaxID=28094 RepID=A0A1X7E8Q4_TRICW|nr:alpha/beta hydrolase [Trinickia caryophylli]PMS13101.1 alpha/beta hydrolase [Trinickia caryophylli]TRX14783.1 alpha/beta fold hydrolase [Trinickia caryophylli]WQE14629.1 alpha/beta hydrolase [Trinickia caryophylli]SMF29589.1 Pimeloyl-ACP methyl ester carboxylesterase [Trinickia caryophylli]
MNTASAREGWIGSDGLRLRYLSWGAHDAPPVVMLHGLRSYAQTWAPAAEALVERYRVIALDQRGRGLSDWDPKRDYYAAAYLRDLETLVDALGLRKFVLVGHSMGGTNAFVYAGKHPARLAGLVIEDMGPGASVDSRGSERIRRELRSTPDSFASWAEARAFWHRQRPNISEAALASRVEHSLKDNGQGRVVWRHDAEGIAAARLAATPEQLVDLWPLVRGLRMPTLVLHGADSDFLCVEAAAAMTAANPYLRAHAIAGATHYVHDDQPDAFNRSVRLWLDSLDDPTWREGADR